MSCDARDERPHGRPLSTIERLENAIETLRSMLAGPRPPTKNEIELASQSVARALVHVRRHLRILEQTTRDLLAMPAFDAAESGNDGGQLDGTQHSQRAVDNEGQRSKS